MSRAIVARRSILGRKEFVPPIQAVDDGWRLNLDFEERSLLVRLMDELRTLLTSTDDNPLLDRLFPTAYPDDEEKEAEYQRLMREELVASRLASINLVTSLLGPDGPAVFDEERTIAFMQSINAIRLVLGTLLGITDDDSADAADQDASPEHQLYDFLSWLLEWTVRALS
jgi:Domain of unknown function (DUF2017)